MEQRFLSKVNKHSGVYKNSLTTECWIWTAGKDTFGYGRINIDGKNHVAHRISYELYKNKIPEGLLIRHSCDNPACVNPDHLELGTHQDNTDDRTKRGRHKYGITIQKGEKNGRAKLKDADVLEIRQWLEFGYTQKVIAELFDVNIPQISRIKTGKTWSHI